ncbi:hypothetical protein GMORB2_7498 [Geosmithia morbida]|uniref:Uncharacterized protein n=1 Tax=Geosmithia morbida TaxID=1094350 RepID=A0A9P5D3F9_9HYPO|nr:uncharacterized protein GMORB2_7498 [Geosmithia morbida]KAF4122506.1 hypothetical protein GMORB2_7498 [Geosmithia morbida]
MARPRSPRIPCAPSPLYVWVARVSYSVPIPWAVGCGPYDVAKMLGLF